MQCHSPSQVAHLQSLARLIRYHSVNATSKAHSGHLTSALSAADLMTGLVFGGTFRFKIDEPGHPNNDRLIFSKGHAAPQPVADPRYERGKSVATRKALKASDQLLRDGIPVRVIDAYSIKPIDASTLREAADATAAIVTVEDHYPSGGLGEAVLQALAEQPVPVTVLAVKETPMSGTGDDLRDFADISAAAIVKTVERLVTREHAGASRVGKGGSR